jgi:hypothetical protein
MKKIVPLSFLLLIICNITIAQNVGIGTPTPIEKLDVNGNVNVSGQLKFNGNAGTAKQIMMKDASNNPIWGDMTSYQNIAVFDCNATAFTQGTNNCTQTWTVPAGVTSILVECWGGGGGGGYATGGAGGGYITGKITVTPASVANLIIGAGGRYSTSSTNGITGGTTSFDLGSFSLNAYGGEGGDFRNLFTTSAYISNTVGGAYSGTGFGGINFYGLFGKAGNVTERNFSQISASEFANVVRFGSGGDAGNTVGSGAKGGYMINSASFYNVFYTDSNPSQQGGGGGADQTNGFYGRGGRIIVRW